MRPIRPILALTLITATLCADRFAPALPIIRPQLAQRAMNLATRFTAGFKQTAPSLRPQTLRPAAVPTFEPLAPLSISPPQSALLAWFNLRLPPPIA